jgi:phosphoribosylamine--glycine ligase
MLARSVTEDEPKPKLIEFNCRFGDPEAMNVLSLLESNFSDVCRGIIDGKLGGVKFAKKATVCKNQFPKGYPENPEKDKEVKVDEKAIENAGARVFYASVYQRDSSIYTMGSRSVGIVGIADSIEEAEKVAESSTAFVDGNLVHRRDIGTPALIRSRIEHMNSIFSS